MSAQSYISDELTHCVGRAKPNDDERYALLVEILRTGWLKPSLGPGFVMFSDGQKRLSTNEAITCTMLCFCDIPLEHLALHMQKYSPFGIAFSKKMLLDRGATQVYYVASNARNHAIGIGPGTVGERFDELRSDLHRMRNDLEEYVTRIDGAPGFLAKLSPPGTPARNSLGVFPRCKATSTGLFSVGSSSSRPACRMITRRIITWTRMAFARWSGIHAWRALLALSCPDPMCIDSAKICRITRAASKRFSQRRPIQTGGPRKGPVLRGWKPTPAGRKRAQRSGAPLVATRGPGCTKDAGDRRNGGPGSR